MVKPESVQAQTGDPAPTLPPFRNLILAGLALVIGYLMLAALLPLPPLHFPALPDAVGWQLQLSRALFAAAWSQGNHTKFYILLLSGLLLILSLLYFFSLKVVWPVSTLQKSKPGTDRGGSSALPWLLIIGGGAAIYGIILLLQPGLFSGEVFTSIMAGRMQSIYHVDPLVTLPAHFPRDPFLKFVPAPHQKPLYGPLWLGISALLTSFTTQIQLTVLLFKGLALLAHLLNIFLIWLILGSLLPQHRINGTLMYAWNPLVLIELAGNGHSEGLLLSMLLLAVLLHIQQRPWTQTGALILLGVAGSLSFLALLLIPLYAWFLVQCEYRFGRTFWEFCWRAGLGLACFLIPLIPLWHGASTFLAYTSLLDLQHGLHTPLTVISEPIRYVFKGFVHRLSLPSRMDPTSAAELLVKTTALLLFGFIYVAQFTRIHRVAGSRDVKETPGERVEEKSTPTGLQALLKGWQRSMFWALICIVTPFWPWYTLPVIGLTSLLSFDRSTIALLLLSCSLLFTYPLQQVITPAQSPYLPALTFGIPLIYILITKSRLMRKDQPS